MASAGTFTGTAGFFADNATTAYTIDVSGLTGDVSALSVRIDHLTHSDFLFLHFLLVAPDGQTNLLFFDRSGQGVNITDKSYLFTDEPDLFFPTDFAVLKPVSSGITITASDFGLPSLDLHFAAPNGSDTLESAFSHVQPNGQWTLYVLDDAGGGGGTFSDVKLDVVDNIAPVISAPVDHFNVETGSSITFSAANGNLPASTDVDYDHVNDFPFITITTEHGTIQNSHFGFFGPTKNFGVGGNAENLVDIFMEGAVYKPDAGFTGVDHLTIQMSDSGDPLTGLGRLTGAKTIDISVFAPPPPPPPPPTYTHSDVNGDGTSDVLLRNITNGQVAEWQMQAGQINANLNVGQLNGTWHFQDTGDFNLDGKADVLWRNDTGQVVIWSLDGNQIVGNQNVGTLSGAWHNQGVADFNADGKSDVLWQNASTGQVSLWTMDGATIVGNQSVGIIGSQFHIQGLLDANGDGKSDVLLRHDNGQVVLWTMNGAQITGNQTVANLGLDWHIAGTGDFGGDGKDDILLRNDNGQVALWTMNGSQIVGNQSVGIINANWHIEDIGDYSHDGKADVLLRNDNGQAVLWEMNGATITANHQIATVAPDLVVQTHHFDIV